MRRAIALACLLAALAVPTAARADGDPPSDVLPLQPKYLPYSPKVPKPFADALDKTLAAAKAAGYPLRVAIIGSRDDLGSVPQYFGRPEPYAGFLQSEISFNKPRPLLVVMPAGFGTANAGPGATTALGKLGPPAAATGEALGRSAIEASLRLAKAAGHPLPAPKLPKAGGGDGGGGGSTVLVFVVPVLLLALGGVLGAIRMRQAERARP